MNEAARVAALLGPTAVGKTSVSIAVAKRLGASIISIDSMQIYERMEIGTAVPSAKERAGVPHHLFGERPPSHELTVAEYQSLARAAIADVLRAGRLPLLVGGSGLYWRAVVDNLEFPPRSASVRSALEAEAGRRGGEELHRRLHAADPIAASTIAPANVRRTIRALEVIEITGRPFSDFSHAWSSFESRYNLRVAGLKRPRAELFARIEARVDLMLSHGLVEEARALAAGSTSRAARQALGYRQILDSREGAELSHIRAEIVRATKRFARRQESWFRTDPRVVWFEAGDENLVELLIDFFTTDPDRPLRSN